MNWISFSEAETYFAGRPFSDDWEEASNALKIKCLDWAELLLDSAYNWADKAFIIDNNGEITVHDRLKKALCEEALWLIQYNASYGDSKMVRDIESLSINGINAKFSSHSEKTVKNEIISPNCFLLLGDFGTLRKENDENGKILSTMLEI